VKIEIESIKEIGYLDFQQIESMDINKRKEFFINGLNEFKICEITSGYGFEMELVFKYFCVAYQPKGAIQVFKSGHNGCIAPNFYVESPLTAETEEKIRAKIIEFAELEKQKILDRIK
jgi:hypothetical protein